MIAFEALLIIMTIIRRHNLKIHGVISHDSGMFQCVGMNNAGSVQASAFLEVIPLGNFLLQFLVSQSFSVHSFFVSTLS